MENENHPNAGVTRIRRSAESVTEIGVCRAINSFPNMPVSKGVLYSLLKLHASLMKLDTMYAE